VKIFHWRLEHFDYITHIEMGPDDEPAVGKWHYIIVCILTSGRVSLFPGTFSSASSSNIPE
jgi:hypothetical protein